MPWATLAYFLAGKYNKRILKDGGDYMEYLTAKEVGEKWGITPRMVNYHCTSGRIPGAVKKGDLWLIPADAEKPVDRRRKGDENAKNHGD